jgi:isoleucyl-tRNA synthetase
MSTEAQPTKRNYRDTLNLPKTPFPMKANLVQNEPASLKRWSSINIYERTREARNGARTFVFHDGPPYANGDIHLGHLLNKCLKDFVVRTRTMEGFDTPYVPGWDCHGLPIEAKVMTDLISSGKIAKLADLPEDTRRMAVRKACQAYAEKYVKLQRGQMERLLTLADYEHPYLTMSPSFEGATIELFAELVAQGIVYRQLKPVHWSIANQTALAEAELEYQDREDPSIYVDFEADDADAVYDAFGLPPSSDDDDDEDNESGGIGKRPGARPSFMIWTTTPWTLPANLAIAVHPKFEYALARIDGNYTVVAKELLETVAKIGKAEDVTVIATTTGDKLVGLRYRHPFVDGGALASALHPLPVGEGGVRPRGSTPGEGAPVLHRVVAADYVTLEDGTGLVHTAPGHGVEDYQTGLRENLPIYCPVQDDGTYDRTAPEFVQGKTVWDANPVITDRLSKSGHLFHAFNFMHSYPHDWRSKTPVIFRATEQWFIGVDRPTNRDKKSLRELALSFIESNINFIPEWGRNRLRGMLDSRPDWCISRQRAWGLPIPAFFQKNAQGDTVTLLTAASVRAVAKVFRDKGSDAWFQLAPKDLLAHYDLASDPDAPKNINLDSLEKSRDILDVWFESGSSWHSALRDRFGDDAFPVELYLEGSDQHRGWFQSSLLVGLGATGRPPYKGLLTHGFMVDKDGKKMSKSLGNALNVEDLLKNYGADVCRWWVASLAYESDIKVDPSFFETAGESYRKVRNTIRFLLSNLDDFTPCKPEEGHSTRKGDCVAWSAFTPHSIDAWALGQANELSKEVRAAYDACDFRAASLAIYDFCNDTLSAVYLAAVKDRLYCDAPNSERRRRTQSALYDIADLLCRLLAPLLPHTADEAFRALHKIDDKASADSSAGACIHLHTFLGAEAKSDVFPVKADATWGKVFAIRDKALLALETAKKNNSVENPLDAALVLPDADRFLAHYDPVDLADLMGVSRVTLDANATDAKVIDLRNEPRCERSWKRDGTVKPRSDGGMLSERDALAVGV